MPFSFSFQYDKKVLVPKAPDEVLAFLQSYTEALPGFFPGLCRFEELGPKLFEWEFDSLSYGGKQLKILLTTIFEESSSDIRIVPSSSSAETKLRGFWRVHPNDPGCALEMHFILDFLVPLPALMKGMVTPLASSELKKLFDRYADNLQKHFS